MIKDAVINKKILMLDEAYEAVDLLQCAVKDVEHIPYLHEITYRLPNHNCPDMSGAIMFAKMCDPNVKRINVYEDNSLINVYFKENDCWEVISSTRP